MSAARARRRLMRYERYWRRALLLGAALPGFAVTPGHHRAWGRVDRQSRYGWPWTLPDPHRAGEPR